MEILVVYDVDLMKSSFAISLFHKKEERTHWTPMRKRHFKEIVGCFSLPATKSE